MKELPQYYVIKRDPSNPLWEKYISWLNNKGHQTTWTGTQKFYGNDGTGNNEGWGCWSDIGYFHNSPALITLEQWDEAVNGFVLPEKWCVEVTSENEQILKNWCGYNIDGAEVVYSDKDHGSMQGYKREFSNRFPFITTSQFKKHVLKENDMYDPREDINKFTNCKMSKEELLEEAKRRYPVGTKFKSAHNKSERTVRYDGNYYLGGLSNLPSVLVMISEKDMGEHLYFEGEWAEIITPKTEPMKDRTITAQQAQSIIDVAKRSCEWKKRLARLWGEEIAMKHSITIDEDLYKEMRSACIAEQHTLFDSIFGKDKKEFTSDDLCDGETMKSGTFVFMRNNDRIINLVTGDSFHKSSNDKVIGKKVRITNIEFEEVND